MKNILLRLAGLLIFAAGVAGLHAQTNQPQSQDQPSPATTQSQDQEHMTPASVRPFSGTIVKEKGKLVLKDSSTNHSYQLDDQDRAKQFTGKQVKVSGRLDGKTIHVESIELVSE